jgi:hypothetical protein
MDNKLRTKKEKRREDKREDKRGQKDEKRNRLWGGREGTHGEERDWHN